MKGDRLMRLRLLFGLSFLLLCSAHPAKAQVEPYLGQVDIVAFNFPPKGWAFCNGQLLAINQNQALFSLLGTFYGGDGIRTFALPDLRGRIAIGMGQGPGLANYTVGEVGGEEYVTLNVTQMPAHTHVPMGTTSAANALGPGGAEWAATTTYLYSSSATPSSAMNPAAIGTAGGGQPHENRAPYLTMSFIIALQGIFPSRN